MFGVDKGGKESELGVARLNLETDLLAKGKDRPLGPLKIVDDKSNAAVGELTCAVSAVDAMKSTGSGGSSGGGGGGGASETIVVEVHELTLKKAPAARRGLQVLIDMLGVSELEATSKKASAKNDGVWAVNFEKEFVAGPSSKLRDAIATA